jgi:hypothetical protein
VAELPAGPSGDKGTLVFTNCWGIAATTAHPDLAKAFVEAMTTEDQQLAFAKGFGVIPSIRPRRCAAGSSEPAGKSGRFGRSGGGRRRSRHRDGLAGALFMAPAVILLVVFVLLPVLSALWVSVSDWSGNGSPLTANFAGLDNYRAPLTKPGLAQRDLATYYQTSFLSGKWGQGAAIAFILFAIIVVLSLLQRFVMRDRTKLPRRRRFATSEGK